ncbi:MAG: 16S rRNA (guanine(966)-N(2))-methyltransferase RsmD [Gammaproteobacteria bacterium]|jgi:16S rRNA (guanine966-N2)-methyltransferase
MKANRAANQVRIIAGCWRGRKLSFAPVAGVRPTPDRVRETLFNWLSPVIRDARCLDLYAGSGALGIEAASRGASRVVLVDSDPQVVKRLREQLQLFGAAQIEVVQSTVEAWLASPAEPFDIVFLDPPFRRDLLPACLQALERGGWLAADARVYIEGESDLQLQLPGNWELTRSKRAGQVGYHLARRV